MKNLTILSILFVLAFTSCKVDKDLEPSFQNDISQFIYVNADIDGESINKNLSLYWKDDYGYWDYGNNWIHRTYSYTDHSATTPNENYFDVLSGLYFNFETKTANIENRIGTKMPLASNSNIKDNQLKFGITYRDIRLLYVYEPGDSITYTDIKDTLIDNRTYELTQFLFDELTLEDDSGAEFKIENLELRQVLIKE